MVSSPACDLPLIHQPTLLVTEHIALTTQLYCHNYATIQVYGAGLDLLLRVRKEESAHRFRQSLDDSRQRQKQTVSAESFKLSLFSRCNKLLSFVRISRS